MAKLHFKQIKAVTGSEKDRRQLEHLGKKIIGIIEIDFSCFRTFVLS